MKQQLAELIAQALERLRADGVLPADAHPEIHLERGRDKAHGDYASNLAMRLAKPARRPPRALAEALVAALPEHPLVARVEVAGPGFINFHLREAAAYQTVHEIWQAGDDYGRVRAGAGRRVLVEFVSANPTGPLHVGHGRGAAFGAALASLLDAAGYEVEREYYVNDAGRQMDILAVSVWLRYLESLGEAARFPDNGYRGDYIRGIAGSLQARDGDALRRDAAAVQAGLPADAADGGDKERHIDALILRARELLGKTAWRRVHDAALEAMVADIREDLEGFGVDYDRWFSERSLTESGAVDAALDRLRQAGHLELRDGAEWFLSSRFGDEKDRVVRRADGQPTYFASDIAYHLEKLGRGYDTLIDVWGADHHGYVARVKAALQALGEDPERLQIRLVQFAILYRGGERLQMSTRSGEFVTLRELRSEVGDDAARFFYVMRRPEQHLDFDLDLAKSESADNPVYYVQYAHARVCSVMAALEEKGLAFDAQAGLAGLERLTESHEKELLATLGRFPELVESAAEAREPHQLAQYLRELATAFHSYYNAHPFLVEETGLRDARLVLVLATRQVIRNGLRILGVSAPESM